MRKFVLLGLSLVGVGLAVSLAWSADASGRKAKYKPPEKIAIGLPDGGTRLVDIVMPTHSFEGY